MRRIREITASEENFRTEQVGQFMTIKRDPVQPEPVGTVVLMPFRITGYDRDCDGSLMARLSALNGKGKTTGWEPDSIGLYPHSGLVVTEEELQSLFAAK